MSDLKKKLNEILSNLDENIKDKEDLEYVKSQIYNISMLFLDEIDKLAELNLGRLNVMIDREKELSKRISAMEKVIKNIEKEMYIAEEEMDFTIQCPYCNAEFVEDFTDGFKHEVRCPECDNVVQLEWCQDEECECDCDHEHDCNGDCSEDNEEQEEYEEENEEDDM